MKKLFVLVSGSFPTASEALFLYALDMGRLDTLMSLAASSNQQRFASYSHTFGLFSGESSAQIFIEANLDKLESRYLKVYEAWQAKYRKHENELHMKSLLLTATKRAIGETWGASHRICVQLGLNSGNFYAYLNGNVSAVSLQVARKIYAAAKA